MLYHFQIELSDVDRDLYKSLDFRIAQHPSETGVYLLTRALAYTLSYREHLEFSAAGLGDPEAPALQALGPNGQIELWIEVGNPSNRKLHKAGKTARQIQIFSYKNAELLKAEIAKAEVYQGSQIQIYSFDPKFLAALEKHLKKNNRWSVLHQQGQLDIDTGGVSFTGEWRRHQ